jgi:transaldolase
LSSRTKARYGLGEEYQAIPYNFVESTQVSDSESKEARRVRPAKLHNLGQSLWLDNITRDLLNTGGLQRYIEEFAVTGLTSNPTIFDHAIRNSVAYDEDIARMAPAAESKDDQFFSLALADLSRAAELFQPTFARTDGVDGWVSLEVSPLLAHHTASSVAAARDLHRRAGKPNLFIKIPGTPEGLPAIEAAIFAGVPVNITLLFSTEQYLAAADAYARGIERRIGAGLNPAIASVASVFVSRWDVAVHNQAPSTLKNRLGIAVAQRTDTAYREWLATDRFHRLANAGARPAPALGQHGDERSYRFRYPVCGRTGRTLDGQHAARGYPQGIR